MELGRLEETVMEVNQKTESKVYVPISGICVGDTSFTQCVGIRHGDIPIPSFQTVTEDSAMRFMVFLIDQISMISRQRSKMLISHYFLESADA